MRSVPLSRCPSVHLSICPAPILSQHYPRVGPHSNISGEVSWPSNQTDGVSIWATTPTHPTPTTPPPTDGVSEWASDWLTDGLTGLPVCRPRRCEISATAIPYAIVLHINQSAAAKSLSPDWHFLATFGFGFFRFLFLMRVRYGKIVNWIELISKAKTAQLKPHETVARPHRLAFLGPGQNHFPYCSSGG